MDAQSGQHLRQNLPEHLDPADPRPTGLRQQLDQRLGFGPVLVAWDLPGRRVQIGHHLDHSGRVLAMKVDQLPQDETAGPAARMAVNLAAGHHLVGDPTEPASDLHVGISWILAGGANRPQDF